MNSLIAVALLAAVAVANAGDLGYTAYGSQSAHYPVGLNHANYAFHGHYPGKCGNDGFYYKDHSSFVICSNGNAYDQPCAPGTRNSEYGRYNSGHNYHYRDFCDVNLVDYGYGAHHTAGHGYVAPVAPVAHGHGYAAQVAHGHGYVAPVAYAAAPVHVAAPAYGIHGVVAHRGLY